MVPNAVVYRWLAQFFLSSPSLSSLESYRSEEGQRFLSACKAIPALSPFATMVEAMVTSEADLQVMLSRFSSAFSQAFDIGGPRSAPPYASVYLSERGLLYQQPARDMYRILYGLQMSLPAGVNEPSDHLGIQLHVAAELCDREAAGLPVPLSSAAFLQRHVLSWLPAFADQCSKLADPGMISLLAQTTLALVRMDVDAECGRLPDPAKIKALAKAALALVREDVEAEECMT